ncbi:MAG: Gldg family protein, partial [Xanthomonadaceae bacterium]|nr:Gldg family protein [Xanthomonadaceae bacterium]
MRLSRRLDGWLFAVLLLAGAGALGFFSTRYAHVSDWTANGRLSLSPRSRAVLAQLHGPVDIVSYASPQGDLRAQVAGFLQRYRQAKPDLTLRFVDPQQDPARMRQLGISVDGELILHYHGHQQQLTELSEDSVTNALQRLIRGRDRIVAFVTGDGERLPSGQGGADMGMLMGQL